MRSPGPFDGGIQWHRTIGKRLLEEFLHRSRDRSPERNGTFRNISGTADRNAVSLNHEDARLIGSVTKDEEHQNDDA